MKSVVNQLSELPLGNELSYATDDLVAEWNAKGITFDAVEDVLRFMESHSQEDFGAPGSLTHFVEKFYRSGYEQQLITSLRRRPTSQTVLMLYRVLRGSDNDDERRKYIEEMRLAEQHPLVDSATLRAIKRYTSKTGETRD